MKLAIKIVRSIFAIVGSIFAILFFMALLSALFEVGEDAPLRLLFGWLPFLLDRIRKATVNWSGVGMLLLCLVLTAGFAHSFCAWLWRGSGRSEAWRSRWTAAGLAVVLLLFVSGMAVTGVAHQIGWLVNSPQPLAQSRIGKAQADTLSIASAVSIYSAHCGGLPDNGSTATNCPVASGQNGALPAVLLSQQTNGQNQVGGPFLNALPRLPSGWTGSGASYKYSSTASGTFTICGRYGDRTAVDSNGRASCP